MPALAKVLKLGQAYESMKVFRSLFDVSRRPRRVRIVCPIIKRVELEGFHLFNGLVRFLSTGTVVTIVTRDFLENKARLEKEKERLRAKFERGDISEDFYRYLLDEAEEKIRNIEMSEECFARA